MGVSHVHVAGQPFKPVATMAQYLDRLSAEGVPSTALCLAALGPKMLELARERTAGAHPYLITPEHTAQARAILGDGRIVAPEQGVALHPDPAKARELARAALAHYKDYPNYHNSWLRLGFSVEEIDRLDDRLIDAPFACGPLEVIRERERVDQHFAAGSDHVCLQVVTGEGLKFDAVRRAWRELASGLVH